MSARDDSQLFDSYWKMLAEGRPEPEREFVFAYPRKYRFDFAWNRQKVAVEVDGGQWVANGGRHARDVDREKLNLAAEKGWRVLRFSPQMLKRDPLACVTQVSRALEGRARKGNAK